MIKLFSLKQQKKDEESAGGNRTGAGGKKASAAQLRIQKGRLDKCPGTGEHLPPSCLELTQANRAATIGSVRVGPEERRAATIAGG